MGVGFSKAALASPEPSFGGTPNDASQVGASRPKAALASPEQSFGFAE